MHNQVMQEIKHLPKMGEGEPDDIDRRLLDLLQDDASRTNQALAEAAGVSPATALRRVRRLTETGVIERQVAVLAPRLFDEGLTAITEVSLDRQGAELLDAFEARATAEAGWFPDPPTEFDKTSAFLVKQGAPASEGATALGLVTVDTEITVVPEKRCRGLSVTLRFTHPVLRVIRDLSPGTCAHAHVLRHE